MSTAVIAPVDTTSPLYSYAQFVFQQLNTMFSGKVNAGQLSNIVLQGMLAIKGYIQLAGSSKKSVVVMAIQLLIDAQPSLDPATKALLDQLTATLVPALIDDLYWAGSKAVQFQVKNGWCGLCKPKAPPTPAVTPVTPVTPAQSTTVTAS
jgi:hypothetical protein